MIRNPFLARRPMKPVLILQHLSSDGPAYLGTWLRQHGVAVDVRNTEAGDDYPDTMDSHAALAVLGGAMSANDPLPSLRQAQRLILDAMRRELPVLGHCLGGQLMARALGAAVFTSPAPEIGWQPMTIADTVRAREWFGQAAAHTVMHWHFEAFELPAGAEALATSPACPVQAFAVGPHLAMQFHVEVDAAKLDFWSSEVSDTWESALRRHPATVQDGPTMRSQGRAAVPAQQRLADRIYGRWLGASAWSHSEFRIVE